MSFKLTSLDGIQYYQIKSFEDTRLVNHLFSTKIGWNKENTLTNIAKLFNTEIDNILISNQVHSTNIAIVEDILNYRNKVKIEGIDGLITSKKGIILVTYYADCVPLFFLDANKKIIALAHAGWRGTVGNIGGKVVATLKEKYNSNVEDILVAIGPSIGPCCYEVGIDVYNEFKKRYNYIDDIFTLKGNNKWYLNLWEANRKTLEEEGVFKDNITISNICTSCNLDKFFSYRREKGTDNRMVAAIQLKN